MSTRFLANFKGQLLACVTETDISAYYDSDHSPVIISLTPEDQVPREPGF